VATNARKDFPVFDCDSHVVEPPAIWDEYVPARSRAWVKTQFCFHTDSDLLFINGRVVLWTSAFGVPASVVGSRLSSAVPHVAW